MKKLTKTSITVDGVELLAKIYEEPRRNTRASMNRNGVILRMPNNLTTQSKATAIQWLKDWISDQLKDAKAKQLLVGKIYQNGDTISIFGRMYQLKITTENRKTHGAKLKGTVIELKLSNQDIAAHIPKAIRQLISKTIAADCMDEFTKRVDFWNDAYFKETINNIRFKNNQSNWGSCSSKQNLNFSARLLFAPSDVIDYVIVHELAHLKELNHSQKFWKIVADVMPNYKEKEKWLNQNGHLCQF